jgi:hypothetical protein
MEDQCVEPPFLPCIAKYVMVNPFKEVKWEKAWLLIAWLVGLLFGQRKAGAPLLNSAQQPRGQGSFHLEDRANPQRK